MGLATDIKVKIELLDNEPGRPRNEFQRLETNLICKLCDYFECEVSELIIYVKE